MPADGRKVKGTIHWVSAHHALPAEVRLYERLFDIENPLDTSDGKGFKEHVNPDSVEILSGACVEPSLAEAQRGAHFQFERLGYFNVDPVDSRNDALVFNRTLTLRDTWAKNLEKLG
jgi:glutaminyl-tRNA synthetase